jgi:hypothetical protein
LVAGAPTATKESIVRKSVLAGAAMVAVMALPAAPVSAHQGNQNFRSELDGVRPAVPGVEVEVLNFDDSLRLQNRSGRTVMVRGYQGEPYVRILADGTVQVNTNSPSYYLNEDRYGETDVPAEADSDLPPAWETIDRTGQYSWHDHRIHYMSTGTPPQVEDEDRRTKVFDYRVPIEVGGQPAAIAGTLFWVGDSGGFPAAPFAALAAAALLLTALVLWRRRRCAGRPDAGEEAREAW